MPARVSVIVAVRNRRLLLGQLLDALAHQTFQDFEVVIVDDGSVDASAEEAGRRRLGQGYPVVLRTSGLGAVRARILGVAESRGELLAFTDSDCRPEPRWLEAAVAAFDRGADLVHGPTRPPRPLQPLERSVSSGQEGLFPTCNLLVRRKAYEQVGGFDESAAERLGFRWGGRARGLGFGEDTLLAWSLIRAGFVAAFEPAAGVEHHIFRTQTSELLGRAIQGGAFPALVREVPELRSTLLVDRVLLGRRRLPFYVTLLALLRGRRGLAAAAFVSWTGTRAFEIRRAPGSPLRKLQILAIEMAADAVLGLALMAGSVQARSVVL